MNYIEQVLIYEQIEKKFNEEFEIECPSKKQTETIITDKELILNEFEKWYNFWDIRDSTLLNPNIDITSKNNILLFIKKNICELRKVRILNEIENIGLYDEFIRRINNKKIKNDEIIKIRKKMEILNDISKQLYNDCIKETFNDINILDPVNWLANQENMRKLYESYINKTILSNNTLTENLINNKLIKYMKFMYDNYPIGFGDELIKKCKNKEIWDGAEIYYEKLHSK